MAIVASVVLMVVPAVATAAQNFYVAPNGSDAAAGDISHPFGTLQRAQQAVRASTPTATSNVVVNLRAGTYTLGEPLMLSGAAGDSGRGGRRVVYQPYGYGTANEESAVISGGRRITGWSVADPSKGIWMATVSGDLATRQLFVNGHRAKRAALDSGIPGTVKATKAGYRTTSTAPQAWARPGAIEFDSRGSFPWSDTRCGVDSISGNASESVITMDQPCYENARALYSTSVGVGGEHLADPTDVVNSLSFLDQPGEFYVEERAGDDRVFYIPRSGEDLGSAKVIAPVLETLVGAVGTEAKPIRNVTFRGLRFRYATWLEPSSKTGFPSVLESAYYPGGEDLATVPGEIYFRGSENIQFFGNRLEHLGGLALEFSEGTAGNLIEGNRISDVSDGGIALGTLPPQATMENPDNSILDNWVHEIGVEYVGAAGVWAPLTQNSTIAHNEVSDTPYSGIVSAPIDDVPGVAEGLRILENHVSHTMQVMDDGGAIYLLGDHGSSAATGALVKGNLVDGGPPAHGFNQIGLYSDEGAEWIKYEENAVYGYLRAAGGCQEPFIKDVSFVHNFWDTKGPEWLCEEEGELIDIGEEGNTTLPKAGAASACAADPTCHAIQERAGLEPRWRQSATVEYRGGPRLF